MGRFAELAFTPAVQALQERMGSRKAYARQQSHSSGPDALGEDEVQFLSARDSFYLASVGANGWPYIQHRGGAPGFVHVLDPHTLAFADLRGNKQYITTGNVSGDDRVALIFLDYPNRSRLKLLGHASIVSREQDAKLLERLAGPDDAATAERAFVIRVEGFDWNCPQHITPRFTEAEIERAIQPLVRENESLRAENEALRKKLAAR